MPVKPYNRGPQRAHVKGRIVAKKILMIAAISGLLAVALGAFGAHGLKTHLAADMLAIYQTSVQYHFYHSFALLITSLVMVLAPNKLSAFRYSALFFIVGTLVFSGSLYLLAISGARWLGAITPIGGLLLIAGWIALAVGSYQWQNIDQVEHHE